MSGEKISQQQDRFCREYVVDYNGTQAAIRAGYSKKTARSQASRLLTNENILSRIRAIQIEELKKMSVTPESVILKFLEIYDRCTQAKPVMKWDSTKHEYVESGMYTFDAKGAIGALTKIGEYLAMFKNKVEHSGSVNMGNKELSEILNQLKARNDAK